MGAQKHRTDACDVPILQVTILESGAQEEMKTVKITCDGCSADLTTSRHNGFRLHLSSRVVFSTKGSKGDLTQNDPLKDDLYFCNVQCVSDYLNKQNGRARKDGARE